MGTYLHVPVMIPAHLQHIVFGNQNQYFFWEISTPHFYKKR